MLHFTENALNASALKKAQTQWDAVAKPLHSLGKLEDILSKIAGIQGTSRIRLAPRCCLVFCADHGVVAEGVTQTGQEVTSLVAASIAGGEANVNLMAARAEADVFAVDMGMVRPVQDDRVISRRIGAGTNNIALESAMTRAQTEAAVQAGIDLVGEMAGRGYALIATGEMGIGNTTSCSAICCALLNVSPEAVVGRGAGLSDEGLLRKRDVVSKALQRVHGTDPMEILTEVGGFEIAAITGAYLGGMTHRVPVIIDGVIGCIAALLASRICPRSTDFMIPSHMSREPAARQALQEMHLSPVIDADMALGEGTGAVALMPLMDMALNVYQGVHTFDRLGMDAYTPQGE